MKISLKELKESQICLKIILRMNFLSTAILNPLLSETEELISIFRASIKTSKRKQLTK
ncbi:MAG: four helix bundle protein [Bacteroidota bacterium]